LPRGAGAGGAGHRRRPAAVLDAQPRLAGRAAGQGPAVRRGPRPQGGQRMSADAAWANRIESKSETSDRIYVVSQPAEKGYWAGGRRAVRLAGTGAVQELVDEYEAAAGRFGDGDLEVGAAVVREARFRLEAYAAYLGEQKAKLEVESNRITRQLLDRMEVVTSG